MWERSCFDCKNAIIMEDRSVGIEAYVEDCKHGDKPEIQAMFDKELDETTMAKDCPYFDPHLYTECANCKTPINQPIYSWELFVVGAWCELPVCSEKCKAELQIKVDKEIEELRKEGW